MPRAQSISWSRIPQFPWIQYGLILVATILLVVVQNWLSLHQETPFILLYPGAFLSAWWFGFWPTLFMLTISLLSVAVQPITGGGIWLLENPAANSIKMALFFFTSLGVSLVVSRGRTQEQALNSSKRQQFEAVQELRDLRDRFARSAQATNLGIWYCDLPFDELIWSREVKEHFWLPPDVRVTIDTFYELIHPGDRDRTREAIETAIREHSTYDITYRTVNPADPTQVKFIRAIGWTDYDAAGNPTRFDGITLDNTRVRALAAERDESLEIVETINSLGRALSAELDLEKLVQGVTDAATQVSKAEFGAFFYNVRNEQGESYTLYTISGVPREMFSKFPMPRNTQVFAPTFNGEGIVRSDDIRQDPRFGKNAPYHGMPQGHLPVVSYLAVPVISRSGEVIGGLFFGHSKGGVFTERAERIVSGIAAQAAIAMDNARLFERANKAIQIRDEFLSISSHELKTPLTPLKLQFQVLARHVERGTLCDLSDEQILKMVHSSEKQIDRLNALVDDLLDVSRISSGKLTLNLEPTDLTEVVREVTERYRPQFQALHCDLAVHVLHSSLPAKVDRLRLEQALVNLLTNAMKYAPGKPVEVSLSEESGQAVLRVRDQGIGISPENQKRIFGRFERVASTSHYGGLGLGLFIVNQIVAAHQGKIEVESDLGKGSTFTITLPAGIS